MTTDLPFGWASATLPQLMAPDGVLTDGDWVESKDQDPGGEVRLTQLADVGDGVFRDRSNRFLTRTRATELGCTFLAADDILIARMPDPLGRACTFPGSNQVCVTVVDVCIVRPGTPSVLPRWLMHFINAPASRIAIDDLQKGSTRKRISKANLCTIPLPVPPTREQRCISDALDSYTTRLDEATTLLERVQRNLKRYRASVLKAAVEGRLVPTEAELARAEKRAYEPASALLGRILVERRQRWEKEGRRGKHEEPSPPDTNGLPKLPPGWCWAAAGQLCDFITKGTTPAAEKMATGQGEVPYIKVYNLTFDGVLDFSIKPTYVDDSTHRGELARSICLPGDVLMNIVGPPLGKVSVVPDTHPEWNINQAIARFRPVQGIDRRYLAVVLLAETTLRWASAKSKATAGQFNLTLEICRDLPVPVPPEVEQKRVVAEVDRLLSVAARQLDSAEVSLRRSQRLRQSILKWAFEGKLVDQDPNDEPASVLLKRIRDEREPKPSTATRRSATPRSPKKENHP